MIESADPAQISERGHRHAAGGACFHHRGLGAQYPRPVADPAVHRADAGHGARPFAGADLPDVPAQFRPDRRGSAGRQGAGRERAGEAGRHHRSGARAGESARLLLCGAALSRADQGTGAAAVVWRARRHRDRVPRVRGEPAGNRTRAGADRAGALRARSARPLPAGDVRQPSGRAQPADGLSRHRHQRAARHHAADRRHRGGTVHHHGQRAHARAAAATSSPIWPPR